MLSDQFKNGLLKVRGTALVSAVYIVHRLQVSQPQFRAYSAALRLHSTDI